MHAAVVYTIRSLCVRAWDWDEELSFGVEHICMDAACAADVI
jgi:hypothetical protein